MNEKKSKEIFYDRLDELTLLRATEAAIEWDMQVMLPSEGSAFRSRQLELLSKIIHERSTTPDFVEAVKAQAAALDTLPEVDRINVRETSRRLERSLKLPAEHVAEKSLAASHAYEVWTKAKPASDYQAVTPHLEKLVALSRKEADLVGFDKHPYDALLDIYEPGLTLRVVKPLLLEVGEALRKIIPALQVEFSKRRVVEGAFDVDTQKKLSERVARLVGLPAGKTRIDVAPHPFMTTLGPHDARITTRYDEQNPFGALYGTIHECGHALYELQLPEEHFGTPRGQAISLGIHESQSRFLENIVGRSKQFTAYLGGLLDEAFPKRGLNDPELIWNSVNQVQPSLLRVEADEVTYSLHIIVRMLLEEELIAGTLSLKALPARWNELYEHYLGIVPDSDRRGVLQDIHWYSGMFGYFPTYALGNLYGAQFLEALERERPVVWDEISVGNFGPLLEWLRVRIHSKGMSVSALDLVEEVSGEPLSSGKFIRYLERKFAELL